MLDYGYGVYLRRLHGDDVVPTFEWRNDPRIYKWTRQNAPLHWGAHGAWFANQWADKSLSMFMVVDREGKKLGVVGLTDIDLVNRHAEFSCYINPDEHGNGFGTAALKTLFDYGFRVLGLNMIWGETFEGNPAHKTFEKIGMKCTGYRDDFYFRDGKFIRAHLYSVKGSEWNIHKLPERRSPGHSLDASPSTY